MESNFDFLERYWPGMAELGRAAELYLYADSSRCVAAIGLLAEQAAREICAIEEIALPEQASHTDRLRELKHAQVLPPQIEEIFHALRKARDSALYLGLEPGEQAGVLLHLVFNLCYWFMEVYGVWVEDPPVYRHPADTTGQEDFRLRLLALEEKTGAPEAASAQLPAVTGRASGEARTEKARQAALELALTPEETACLPKENIRLDPVVLPVINYAMAQNGIAPVQSVTVENNTDAALENVDLQITAAPGFAFTFTRHLDYLPAGKSVAVACPELILNKEFLGTLTERVTGVLHFRLKSGGRTLVSDNAEAVVLPFDQWHGLAIYPELLAAFVTPGHPALSGILTRAGEHLEQWTGDPSLDGYQSQDPNRVLHQAAAIYSAIREQELTCTVFSGSFDRTGQRIRLCDTVLRQRQGSCMDLTLLYASCLETVGLHPLLIASPDYILAGVWLEEKMFPECVQDDVSLITKRLASGINELAVVETTCVTADRACSFDDARTAGEQNLTARQVEYIIDVHRARQSRISPLPHCEDSAAGQTVYRKEDAAAPTKLSDTVHIASGTGDSELPKLMQWERKLLDLGMRNTLINLRLTKNQLPILAGSLDALENALADGSDFSILPRPADWYMADTSFETLHEMGSAGIIQAEFKNKRLRSSLTSGELNKTLKELYRTAKTALEENGANTLYLALGMLRWYETGRSTKARYAPIILVPVEIVRKSAAQGYVIRLRDDEPQMNITLLEKLKQDFGIEVNGVDPLPTDEHGIDIRRVLTVLRKAVMEQPRWDVLEAATVGIFSFSQFVMWNDIRSRAEDLLRNKVVRSLIDGKLAWDAAPLEMGQRVNEDYVLLPMPADASQLFAIEVAGNGESFVLHGPPGTGKSQTITSLIANALASGKRVLFVAEKMAALEVVQRRLSKIGIGAFCLELHSNKSRKKDVLEQLRIASEVTKTTTAEQFAARADQLAQMRTELDAYVRELHKILPCGYDLYCLIGEYQQVQDAANLRPFDQEFLRELTKPQLDRQRLTVERLIAAAREIGHPHAHPLARVGCTQYTQKLRTNLRQVVDTYAAGIRGIQENVQRLTQALGLELPNSSDATGHIFSLASHLACWYQMPRAWAKAASPQQYFEEIISLARLSIRGEALEQQLLESFDAGVLELDGRALFTELTQAHEQWFLPKLMGTNKLLKKLKLYAKVPLTKETLRDHLAALRDCQQEKQAASRLLEKYGEELGNLYSGSSTDWDRLIRLAETAKSSAGELYGLWGSYELMHRFCGAPELRETVTGISRDAEAFLGAKAAFDTLLGIRPAEEENWLDAQLALCRRILEHEGELKEWIAYAGVAAEAADLGLSNVVEIYAAGADHEEIFTAWQKALLQGLIAAAIDGSETLNRFSGVVFNKEIEQYRQLDQEWTRISQEEIYCRLASRVPNFTREAAHSSELGILQRCIKSGGRGTSIRRLFEQIPNLLPRLCPCMLMSPISAAQYLDPGQEHFDIVVFDEASQLPTCKAVGVLARGKDAVIVGDPKQMPPTSFFATNTVDEENLEEEDLESILDDCLALNMPQSHLLWHYRSRHESLIAFSNSRFYENKLYTFPSVNDRESKVRLVHVDGVFDRGKTRTNQAEALAVVQEIKERFRDPKLSGQSIGIVTFNISQQHLIDDLLTEAYAQDPELEKWACGGQEPLFIKNLENVQGDERDVILFSIGFGPDEKGKVHMNFGPLNRDGGWRRLNVAVTRARCEMVVFSALRPEQMDMNRTQAEGVAALRSFLEYAQGRTLALAEAELSAVRQQPDGIADAICAALEKEGYKTDRSVGRSEYRIDIGVVDPENPEQYLLGIMLDGEGYRAARTTRDREVAQIGVLNGLGWNIHRVWTLDWWDNREKELSRIFQMLEKLRTEKAEKAPEDPEPQELPAPPPAASPGLPAPLPESKEAPVYTAAKLPAKVLTADEFIEPWHSAGIRNRISQVVETEAPVSLSQLTKRVIQSYGITRAGSRIQAHFDRLLEKLELPTTAQGDEFFCWRKDQVPESYVGFRVCGEGEARRDVRDVPVQEIANAVYTVLFEQISMTQEDLLRETGKKLGYPRLSGNVPVILEQGIRYAQSQRGIVHGANGAFVLTDEGTARAEATLRSF